jgi:hypothetical protein
MTFHKCLKCGHQSSKIVDNTQIVGSIQCITSGTTALTKRRQYGTKCQLCSYSNLKLEIFDSHGHRVI